MSTSPLFELKEVGYSANEVPILKNVSLTISAGSFLAILGPSGSGKSTLLRMFNGLLSPTVGTILYRGESLNGYPVRTLRKEVGMVFQQAALIPGTVRHNLLLRYRWDKELPPTPNEELVELLAKIGLDAEYLVRDCRSLSMGEQQRVALARTLLNDPTVLLLDEPTANLDPPLARKIVSLVHRLHKELNLTTILVSHNHLLIREYASAVAFLISGELVEAGPIENLAHPQTDAVRRFLQQEPV